MSEQIILTSVSSNDRVWLSELLCDTDVRRFLPHLTTDVDKFISDMEIAEKEGIGKLCVIRLGEIGIGFIAIYDLTDNPFIFYAMLPTWRNKGYMKSAIKLIEKFGLSTLFTQIDAENEASMRVLAETDIEFILFNGKTQYEIEDKI